QPACLAADRGEEYGGALRVVPRDERTSGRDQDARPVERAGGMEDRPALDPAVANPEPRINLDPLARLEVGPGQRLHEPACGVLTHRRFPGVTVLVAASELEQS